MTARRWAAVVALCAATACSKEGSGPPRIDAPCEASPTQGVVWSQCQLRNVDLSGTDLRGALLQNVDLAGANLSGADLEEAQLTRVWAEGANLRDANLRHALVNGGDIQKAIYCNTTMPDGSIANGGC